MEYDDNDANPDEFVDDNYNEIIRRILVISSSSKYIKSMCTNMDQQQPPRNYFSPTISTSPQTVVVPLTTYS